MIEMQTIDAEAAEKAFMSLRAGFILSIASIVFLLISSWGLFYIWGPLVTPVLYLLALAKRAGGWKLLGFVGTRNILLSAGAFMLVCSVLLVDYRVRIEGYLVPLVVWAFYTCVENNSLKILGRKLGMNLKPA